MERIHVSVRARPLSLEDAKTSPWRISGNSIFISNHSSKFEFDKIFSEHCKTVEVYESRIKEIVAAAVRGFNGTIFAYGQTNSGKTHTMRGSKTEPGVIPQAVHDLFRMIQKDIDREFLLRMSYLEIYNEDINDLLAPEHRKLQIHENLERGIYVAGLREEIVASPEHVLDLMQFGESHRHIGDTNMNLYSSRSHTIFRMIIESRDRREDEGNGSCDAVRVSVLNLVDLAGSERVAKTGAEGVRLKEGSHINKSLLTLGTVIKKLSEGAESQGGHVPYRDSKLTRFLQPSLGGNANTAMICNVTLAQIHTDETKSSLQFASRALRVTNCAQVNEILTDAALLKRQKKEIEELRAKLMSSHSEHLEEEILNLRNTLLQTELERERIALELEEEKKNQAEWQKRIKEQAKKIENLSSMVLFSKRDETCEIIKKDKRRDTWCLGKLSRENPRDACSSIQSNASTVKPGRQKQCIGPLVPFDELMIEDAFVEQSSNQEDNKNGDMNEDCNLPNPSALLHVTSRKKIPSRKRSLSMQEDDEFLKLQEEYENLLLRFETQRTASEIEIKSLRKQLVEANSLQYTEPIGCLNSANGVNWNENKDVSFQESEAILVIKRLEEQIKVLEMEKLSSQQNLDNVVDLATEQNICDRKKFDELYEELSKVQKAAQVANKQLACETDENLNFVINLSMEVQEIFSDVQNAKEAVQSALLMVDDTTKSFFALCNVFNDFKTSISQHVAELSVILSNYNQLNSCSRQQISELENEKILLDNQLADLQKQLQDSKVDFENSQSSLMKCIEQQELQNADLISHIHTLEKEISVLTSSSLVKEKETFRKDLEKTKSKLKETESKLKIAVQEKTKLEGEKASIERELKRLHGQNSLLERDINKRDSLAGRRHEVFDPKRPKSLASSLEQTLQEELKKMDAFAFEAESRITSLEEELTAALKEKEEVKFSNEDLTSQLEGLMEKLNESNSELYNLKEEISVLRQMLEESDQRQEKLRSSIKVLLEEKEELAMQLTDSLLEIEEERAIWSAKEKATLLAIEEQTRKNNMQITSSSKELSEVRNELASCREECQTLQKRLTTSDESGRLMENIRETTLELDQLENHTETINAESKQSRESPKANSEMPLPEPRGSLEKDNADDNLSELYVLVKGVDLSSQSQELSNEFQKLKNELAVAISERDKLACQMEDQQKHVTEMEFLQKHCQAQLSTAKNQVEELSQKVSCYEAKMHADKVTNNKETTKLRMMLRGTKARLDAILTRYREVVDESDLMHRKFEEAAAKLKDKLATKGIEVLNLKKQLAAKGM
ncbi:kinesin-like protein KIN-7O isoform X1 [Arachis hypogaea]|uniref:kinesin-like protein KIN-7O isoform X1 n=1 Tax=Arachis hypogaea TaxID=3818 RepID=UPI000DEC5302|nr:kinesin-like protein KIN-7O isoform X1 [Arachis hypogaea]